MRTFSPLLLLVLTTLALQACASNNDNVPVQAVENYLNALVEKDANRLTTLSCGEWEDDALLELDSFQAVSARLEGADFVPAAQIGVPSGVGELHGTAAHPRLEGLACEQTGTDGETALVLCNGNIVATYNNEDQQLDLSVRTYQVVQEGGEWLVCGTR